MITPGKENITRGNIAKGEVITARLGSAETPPQTIRLNPNETLKIEGLSFEKSKIDIIGPDMIVTDTATGNKLIIPGVGLFMFSIEEAPKFFFNGVAVGAEDILGKIGFIVNLTDKDYITYTSLQLNQHEKQKDANVSEDNTQLQLMMMQMMRAEEIPQDQPVSPEELLSGTDIGDEPHVTSAIGQPPLPGAAPPSPNSPPASPPDDGGARSVFDFDGRLLQVASSEDNTAGRVIYGGGGDTLSFFYPGSIYQYSTEIIDVGSDTSNVTVYADDPAKFSNTEMSRVLQISPNLPSGFNVTSVVISGLPAGFNIAGATYNPGDGTYTITNPTFDGAGNINLEIHYTDLSNRDFTLRIAAVATFDPGSGVTPTPSDTTLDFDMEKMVHVKPVNAPGDYVMGNDWVLSSTPNENRITTGSGNDHIYGGAGRDVIQAGAGDDTIAGGNGDDVMDGGIGTDTLDYSYTTQDLNVNLAAAAATVGGGETDTISGFENVTGGSGNDTLRGADNVVNILLGGLGNDTIYAGVGSEDYMDGGAGANTLRFDPSSVVYIDMNTVDSNGYWDSYEGAYGFQFFAKNFSTIYGGNIDNQIYMNGSGVTFYGGAGYDLVQDGAGNDTIYTSDGYDEIFLTAGNNYVDAGNNDDYVQAGSGNDTLIGGAGVDVLDYSYTTGSGVTVDLGLATAQNTGGSGIDTISGFENMYGSAFADVLTGNALANNLWGQGGNDTISAGDGDDFVDGGAGNDTLNGGNGADTLTFYQAAGAITIDLSVVTAQNTGGYGTDTISGFENVIGSAYNDLISGTAGNNVLSGNSGNNTVSYANAGSGVTVNLALTTAQNTVGAGTDTLAGFQNLTGSGFNDILTGDNAVNIINGGNGNDTIEGGLGNDTLNGGNNTDTLSYASAAAAVTINLGTGSATGGAGTDTISNFENVTGSAFNDTLTGDGNNNVLLAGDGNDGFGFSLGNDTFDGGNGVNTIGYDFSDAQGGITLNLSVTDINGYSTLTFASGKFDLLKNITVLYFAGNADNIIGSAADETFHLRGGNDTLNAGLGIDTLAYTFDSGVTIDMIAGTATGAGNDTFTGIENLYGAYAATDTLRGDNSGNVIYGDSNILNASNGNDTIDGRGGNDFLYGEGGNDTINGGAGNDYMDGGSNSDTTTGTDTLTYADATAGITINMALTTAQATGGSGTDTVLNFENLIGSAYNDALGGTAGNNTINGGDGNDWINAWSGNDIIDGGNGRDTANFGNAASAVTVSLLTGTSSGGDGNDTLINIESLSGSAFGDVLSGDNNNNDIYGQDGDDTINARGGDDYVLGGNNNDTIFGDNGDDQLYGDSGNDVLEGGTGNDFMHGGTGGDRITYGGSSGAITINMSAGTATGDGNDTFTSIEAFTGSSNSDLFTLTPDLFFTFANVSGGGGAADRANISNGTLNMDAISGSQLNALFDDIDILDMTAATKSTQLNFTTADIDGMNGTSTGFTLRVATGFSLALDGVTVNTAGTGTQNIVIGSGITVTVDVV